MDKIILGILMLKRLTVYEIKSIIKQNFKSMCSDSMGSIQAAIKKLLSSDMITCREYVEKSINKKQYSITGKGRQAFLYWLHTPAAISNPKNMELGKLMFMGLVPVEKRLSLVQESIVLLEKELAELLTLYSSIYGDNEQKAHMLTYWQNDPEYLSGILSATGFTDIAASTDDIDDFQMLTLQYGIDNTQFQVDWYRRLEKQLKERIDKNSQ